MLPFLSLLLALSFLLLGSGSCLLSSGSLGLGHTTGNGLGLSSGIGYVLIVSTLWVITTLSSLVQLPKSIVFSTSKEHLVLEHLFESFN
jgi:hypothetical protein